MHRSSQRDNQIQIISNLERYPLSGFCSYCGVLAAKLFRFTVCGVAFLSEPPIFCKLKNVFIIIQKNRFPEAIGKAVFDVMFLADKFDCENLFACDFKFSRAVLADREGSNVLFLKADELDLAPLLARIFGKLKFCLLSFDR